ncbi:cytochrome P450 [Rhizoctonia solani]|uniref:Cytochrome P450 n=1 Tax=Rhizoctonia solani TaxID=456999 RepID=A0A8H7GZU3_9AGAM|nr:cytochrome P450 [Rhizoctonia solani]
MIDYVRTLYVLSITLGLALAWLYGLQIFGRKVRHPPSPMSLPFFGNLFSIPPGLDHLAYLKLGQQLKTDIFYMNMMGQPVVVLNKAQAATDLLEKRSAMYSDRIGSAMVDHPALLDWANFAGMLPYSDLWRRQRRRINNWLNPRAVRQFDNLQEDVVKQLLGRLLKVSQNPEPFEEIKKQFFLWVVFQHRIVPYIKPVPVLSAMGSATFRLAYGYHLKDDKDPFFLNAVQASHRIFNATMPNNFLVNVFPALAYIPDWLPGAGWKRTAKEWREHKNHAVTAPYEWTKQEVASGNFEPSVLSALLQDYDTDQDLSGMERDEELKELAYILFVGGTDTSSTALVNFVAAMVVNPDVQAKAQAEIDSILGYASRLPTMADEVQMPYVRVLIQEVLRWHPVTPTGGTPHACYQDDVYQGYDIQKGTMIVANTWAMSRDENVYKDPEAFNPERFLNQETPYAPAFGWGRRCDALVIKISKCPGMHFAEISLFVTIASLLATFHFSRKKDRRGNEIIPIIQGAVNSLTVPIKPFDFELQPRSEKHRQLILANIQAD